MPGEIFVPVKLDCGLLSNDSYLVKDKPKLMESTFIYDEDTIPNVSNCSETIISHASHESFDSSVNAQNIDVYNIQDGCVKSTPSAVETLTTICTVDTIGAVHSRKILRVLLDSGSHRTLIKKSVLPHNIIPKKMDNNQKLQTLAGTLEVAEVVKLRDVRLPEFDKNRQINEKNTVVFDSKCRYDIIFGTDFISKA